MTKTYEYMGYNIDLSFDEFTNAVYTIRKGNHIIQSTTTLDKAEVMIELRIELGKED